MNYWKKKLLFLFFNTVNIDINITIVVHKEG